MFIEPIDVAIEFPPEVTASLWDRHLSSEFRFERAEESLNDRNATVLADGSVTYSDSFSICPFPKGLAVEDAVAIADHVLVLTLAE